jgi:NADPH2:quinone reductase
MSSVEDEPATDTGAHPHPQDVVVTLGGSGDPLIEQAAMLASLPARLRIRGRLDGRPAWTGQMLCKGERGSASTFMHDDSTSTRSGGLDRMATMRAWVVDGPGEPADVLDQREIDRPDPPPGFLRLRVDAAAIGLPDLLMCRGTYPLTPESPFTPGQEVVGTVTAVGDGVDADFLGTRRMGVTAFYLGSGGFADEALAADTTMFPAPDWMADADAAGFHIPFVTGWVGLHDRADLNAGEHLVVLGAAGGSGGAAVQLGRAMGAHVIAVAGGPSKADYCRSIGADVVIDHQTDDVVAAVMEATGGLGADVVFDPVGGKPGEAMTRAVGNEGRFLLVGFADGSWPTLDPALLVQRNFSAVGVYAGANDRAHNEAAHRAILPMLADGSLAGVVTTHVDFDDLPEALGALAARNVVGRSVLTL